jgi:hypothetical protein
MRQLAALLTLTLSICFFTTGCLELEDPSDDEELQGGALACPATPLEVIVKGRENRFGLNGQQVALNPSIPIERVCNALQGPCRDTCLGAKARAEATGVRGFQDSDPVRLRQMGVLADDFNRALGIRTRFRDLGADADAPAAQICNAKLLQVIVQGKEHRFGFDGRQVALNPAIPIQNICQGVNATCKPRCAAAEAAAIASGVRGFSGAPDAAKLRQMGVLADQFNATLGGTSDFTNRPILR